MAEKKEKKITRVESSGTQQTTIKHVEASGSATGFRIGAIILWVAAIAFELIAIFFLFGKININFMPQLWVLIILIVLDLICVIIGAQLWKRANHISPASEANKLKFWLWNNMGVIVCCFAFFPIIILMLANKDLDKKTKTIAVIAAIIALLIGGAASVDWNPVSQEQLTAAEATFGEQLVYWSPFGKVYHTHTDCQALNVSESLSEGTINAAIEHGRTRLCKFCANQDNITSVVTDEQ